MASTDRRRRSASAAASASACTWSDYYNPEAEALIEQTNSTGDLTERDKLFKRIGKLLRDDGHSVLISELFSVIAKDKQIEWEPQFGHAFYDLRAVRWE